MRVNPLGLRLLLPHPTTPGLDRQFPKADLLSVQGLPGPDEVESQRRRHVARGGGVLAVRSLRLARQVEAYSFRLAGEARLQSSSLPAAAAQAEFFASHAPAEIARAVQGFAPLPVRLPAFLPAGATLAHAQALTQAAGTGVPVHTLDVWYRLPQNGSLHIWQTDMPVPLTATSGKDPLRNPAGTPQQIGGRPWTRVDLEGSAPGHRSSAHGSRMG